MRCDGGIGAVAGTMAVVLGAAATGGAEAVARATVPVLVTTVAAAGVLGVLAAVPTAIVAASRDPVRDLQEAAV